MTDEMKKTIEEQIQSLADKIAREFDPEKIILFGSWAWGKPGPDSDADLFIVKETKDTRQMARAIDGSLWGRTMPLDILVSTPQSITKRLANNDFFIKDVMSKGKVLYERK